MTESGQLRSRFLALLLCAAALPLAAPAFAGDLATVDEARLGHLEAGVQAQEAVRAVKRLQNTYSHYLDAGLWDDLADLFTDQASGVFQDATVSGKDELRRYLMQRADRDKPGLARGQLNVHLIFSPSSLWGTTARAPRAPGTRSPCSENSVPRRRGRAVSTRMSMYRNGVSGR